MEISSAKDPEPMISEDTRIFATWILVGEVACDTLGPSLKDNTLLLGGGTWSNNKGTH